MLIVRSCAVIVIFSSFFGSSLVGKVGIPRRKFGLFFLRSAADDQFFFSGRPMAMGRSNMRVEDNFFGPQQKYTAVVSNCAT